MRTAVLVALVACGSPQGDGPCPPNAPPGSRCRRVECPDGSPPGMQCTEITSTTEPPPPEPIPVSERPAPPASPASAPAAPPPPAGSVAERFVAAHNKARAKHCAGPLTWSTKLADVAQRWANTLRDRGCMFGHSGGSYGENLAAGTIGALDPEATVQMWYDEIHDYRFPNGGFSMKTGHFTQLVWRATKQVGCGHAQCKGNDIWVCEYDPFGNVDGEYAGNVKPAACR